MKDLVSGLSFIIGVTILGFLLRSSVISFKEFDRTVKVKGLAEKEVVADLVIWPIRFSNTGNDLKVLQNQLNKNNQLILEFLKNNDINDDAIFISNAAITDKFANAYAKQSEIGERYLGIKTITVRSEDINKISNAMNKIESLIKQGVVILSDDYQRRIQFFFTSLNKIKPQMIKEATQSAREVANKFAQDSKSKLGKIKTAQQGIFSIEDRDAVTPHIKKVRVVSTIEFYLND